MAKETNYGYIKAVNFIIYQRNYFLQNNNIEIYSTHHEEKSVAAERFMRTLKNKIYK